MFRTSKRVAVASSSASLNTRPSISVIISWPGGPGHGRASIGDSQSSAGNASVSSTPVGTIDKVGSTPFAKGATACGPPKPLKPSTWARTDTAAGVGKSDGTVAGGLAPAHHFTARTRVSWKAAQRMPTGWVSKS